MKYIYKYIYKGNDLAIAKFYIDQENTVRNLPGKYNEIAQHLYFRYIGPPEAAWQLLENKVHKEYPPIIRLVVHLLDEQQVFFSASASKDALCNRLQRSITTLTAWFSYNSTHHYGRHLLYADFP